MGLDITLARTKDAKELQRIDELIDKIEEECEDIWNNMEPGKNYEEISEERREEISLKTKEHRKTRAKNEGLTMDGDYSINNDSYEDLDGTPSDKYPKHSLFNKGYFRSSYNNSGINHVLNEHAGMDLYSIFAEASGDDYFVYPDWGESLKRVNEAIDKFSKSVEENGAVRIMKFAYNEFKGSPNDCPIKSDEDAMEVYKKEMASYRERKNDGAFTSYSNGDGTFYNKEPLEVVAIIQGVQERYFVDEHLPCSYIVYKTDDLNFYQEALEIVKETIEMAIADNEYQYFLRWSG